MRLHGLILMALGCFCAVSLTASEKKNDKNDDVKWDKNVTPGAAVQLRVNRTIGKFLIYDGTLNREQRAINSFTEDSAFYLNVFTADKRDGLDMVSIQRSYTDRKRVETLESGQKRVMDALPLSNDQINLGPNFDLVGVLHCYAHSPQNAIAYRTDQLLVLKDGSQLRGQVINETDTKIIFLTDTDKFDIEKTNVVSTDTLERAHVCIGETPHYLFPIFPSRPVAPGDTWRFKLPVIIPVEQGGPQKILPTQFSLRLVGRLREVRNGIATVDYQIAGEFDSAAPEFRNRFPDSFHQDNHQVHRLTGTGMLTLDVDKGRILSKEENFNFALSGSAVLQAAQGQEAKKIENHVETSSHFAIKLVPPGARLKSGAVVPDYDTGAIVDTAPDDKDSKKDKEKDKDKDKKKKEVAVFVPQHPARQLSRHSVALEDEAKFLRKAVRAKLMDADKGTAALYVFSQLKQMGAQFSFGQFLVERGLLTQMALEGLSDENVEHVETVSQVGDYKLVELLAEGQSGAVFRAIQQSLRREVALKILSPSVAEYAMYVERFLAEARATAKLNHPNIVQGIDVGSANGLHYFAMELVEAGSARALLLKNNGGLSEDTVLQIGLETTDGLKAAHAAGIIHHDLKPDNLLLTKEGHVKIADLGISQDFGRKSEDNGEFWASPHYAAPERVQGSSGDVRSDIYSLGATLYELLAGQPPFNADKPRDILQMHIRNPLPDLHSFRPDVSVQTASLIRRMLAKNPDERVPSAQSVNEAIERIIALRQQPVAPPPTARNTPAAGVRPPTGRNTPTGIKPMLPRPNSGRFPPRPGSSGGRPSSRFKPRRG